MTEQEDLTRIAGETVSRFGKLTLLVSNAGGGGPKPFDMPMGEFRRAYDLNVFSLFHLAQLAAPDMENAGGGAMLAITSMSAENRNKRMASDASSKAATSHLVRNIAFDLGPMGIRVTRIAPGSTKTDALTSVLNDVIEKKMLAHTPINRLGEPADMANAALFLCSPAASWISGQILPVSPRSIAPVRPPTGPAIPARRPAQAARPSLPARASSAPFLRPPPGSKAYFTADHLAAARARPSHHKTLRKAASPFKHWLPRRLGQILPNRRPADL